MTSDVQDLIRACVAEAVAPLVAEIRALRQPSALPTQARSMSLSQAARQYGICARYLRKLWERGAISGREMPGRGRSGKELRLSTKSLEEYLGIPHA